MTPDFALSLSFDGIRLLHRTAEGWVPVGEVPLDSRDLGGDLAALRRAGLAAAGAWRGTKLLLPAEQVKVLSLEGALEEDEVLAALDGTTPYALSDLVVDHRRAGGRTHVAAVARETLAEAEAFAAEHGFRPVSFAAPLPRTDFPGEAFFGRAEGAAAYIGAEPIDREEGAAPAAEAAEPSGPVELPVAADHLEPPPLDPAPPEEIVATEALAAEEAPPEAPAATEAPEGEAPRAAPDSTAPAPAAGAPEAEPAPPRAPLPPPARPEAILATRAKPLRGQTREPGPVQAPRGARTEPPVVPPRTMPPGAAPAVPPSAPAAGWALSAPAGARPDPRVPSRSPIAERQVPTAAAPVAPAPSGDLPSEEAPGDGTPAIRRIPFGAPPSAMAAPPRPEPATEAERLSIFGTRRRAPAPAAKVGGKPRFLGLVLTLILIALLAAVAAFTDVTPQSVAQLFRPAAPAPAPVIEAPEVGEAPTAQAAAAPPVTVVAPPLPEPEASPEVQVALAPAPEAPVPEAATPAVPAPEEATAAAQAPAPLDPEDAQAAAAAVAAAMAALPDAAEPAEPAPEPQVAAGPAVEAPADPERVYAVTGVWLTAPRLPRLPDAPEASADAPAVVAVAESVAEPPAAAPVELAALAADPGLARPPDPAPPAAAPAEDTEESGAPLLASPEGTAGPSDVLASAVPPAVVPQTSPEDAAPDATAAPAWVNAMAEPPAAEPPQRPEPPAEVLAALAASAAPAPDAGPAVAAAALDAGPALAAPAGSADPGALPAADAAPGAVAWLNAMPEPPAATPPLRPEIPAELLATLLPPEPEAGPGLPVGALAFAAPASSAASGGLAAPGGVDLAALRPEPRPEESPAAEPEVRVLSGFDGPRPGPRPAGLTPDTLPAPPDVTDALAEALAATAPQEPPGVQSALAAIVEGAPDPLAGATRLAVAAARVPEGRPRNFGRVVEEQLDRIARAQGGAARSPGAVGTEGLESDEVAEASVSEAEEASDAAAVPSGPTSTTVAAAATFEDAMRLRDINLIGVYGQPGERRALVRMGNGRYLRVGVGDDLDGGRVTAIGDNALNYVRRGRTEVLVIPGG